RAGPRVLRLLDRGHRRRVPGHLHRARWLLRGAFAARVLWRAVRGERLQDVPGLPGRAGAQPEPAEHEHPAGAARHLQRALVRVARHRSGGPGAGPVRAVLRARAWGRYRLGLVEEGASGLEIGGRDEDLALAALPAEALERRVGFVGRPIRALDPVRPQQPAE